MGSECGWGGYKATALPQRVARLVLGRRRIRQRRPRRATEGHANRQKHKHGKTGPSNTVHSPVLVMAKTQGHPNAL